MTDQPTTPLPLPGAAQRPPAWADAATRRSVNRSLSIALLLTLVGVVAAAACVAIVVLGKLGQAGALAILVALGGLAGGALAGGITMLILWGRTRGFLRSGPWVPGEMTLEDGKRAEVAHGRSLARIQLETRSGSLGDPGDRLDVEVRSDGDHLLITVPPSRRLLRAYADRD